MLGGMASIIQRLRKIPWWIPWVASGGTGLILAFSPNIVSIHMSTEISYFGFVLLAISAIGIIHHLFFSTSSEEKEEHAIYTSPKIEMFCGEGAPYQVSESRSAHVASIVRIGLKNSGGSHASNCKVLIQEISPRPPMHFPVFLQEGFNLRTDDPEKLIDVACQFDHVDMYKLGPSNSTAAFREMLPMVDSKKFPTAKMTIAAKATECQRSAVFELHSDESRRLSLKFIGYSD